MELEDLPLQNLEIRQRSREVKVRRNRIFTSTNIRKEKSQHSRSHSIDDNEFISDIKAKNSKPKKQLSFGQRVWLRRQKRSNSLSNFVNPKRVNLLEQINSKLPPLKMIAQQFIRPTLKHHVPTTSSTKTRHKQFECVKPLTAGALSHPKDQSLPRRPQSAIVSDISQCLESDISVLKEFTFCIPDLNLYLIKIKREEQARSIGVKRKWMTFQQEFNALE